MVEDVLAFLGLQALALAGNWDTELARLQILLADGPDALAKVEPTYGDWLPVVTPVGATAGAALGRLVADVSALRDLVGGSGGSNAWAITGIRTASGAPILANDPHLAPAVPPPWYLAHLRTPTGRSAAPRSLAVRPSRPGSTVTPHGASLPAAATRRTSSGRSWTRPAMLRVDPKGLDPVQRIDEEIAVRGGASVHEEVLVTPRGPIVSGLLDGVGTALSLRATWLEPVPVRGFLDVHRARDFDTFRHAFRGWPGPALNVVYADRDGHIGWQLIGTLPQRRSGNGVLPAPAWGPGWEDEHLPFEALPHALDPEAGFITSANNVPRSDSADLPFLGVDWLDGYRAARIVEALAAKDEWDVAATMDLQNDVTSLPWGELRDLVLAMPGDQAVRPALDLLRAWDGAVTASSPAASVYELFITELAAAMARSDAPSGWRWAVGGGFGEPVPRTSFGARIVSQLVSRLRAGDGHDLIAPALAATVTTLRSRFGDDPAGWAWGRVRPLRLLHPIGARGPFDRLNLGPVPLGGDTNTVAQAGVLPLDPTANPAAIANHRTVFDLGNPELSRFVLAGGQSGNPLSPHYGDLFELWQRGEGVPMPWSHAAVVAATTDRLLLRPG